MINQIVKLGNYIETLKGFAFKSNWYSNIGVDLVKVSDFTDDSIGYTTTKIPLDVANKYLKYSLIKDDVIIQTVGSWPSNPQSVVGKVIKVPEYHNGSLLNQNAVKIIPNNEIDKKYLFYLLKNKNFSSYITRCASGAASQASITLDDIKSFKFTLIPIAEQRKIASFFSAYDKIIENNNRRITILEEMIQRIYREWFVHLRFPGYENVKMVECELGLIPEGWEIKRFDNIALFIKGKKSDRVYENKENSNLVPCILLDAIDTGNYSYVEKNKIIMVDENDCVMVMDGASSGKVIIGEYGAVGSTLAKIDTDDKFKYYLYLFLSERAKQITDNNTGSAIPHANKDYINMLQFANPNDELLTLFNNSVFSMFKLVSSLKRTNKNLCHTRNLLLPRLISNDIDVSELVI